MIIFINPIGFGVAITALMLVSCAMLTMHHLSDTYTSGNINKMCRSDHS